MKVLSTISNTNLTTQTPSLPRVQKSFQIWKNGSKELRFPNPIKQVIQLSFALNHSRSLLRENADLFVCVLAGKTSLDAGHDDLALVGLRSTGKGIGGAYVLGCHEGQFFVYVFGYDCWVYDET